MGAITHIGRMQLPLIPAYALTIHKTQEMRRTYRFIFRIIARRVSAAICNIAVWFTTPSAGIEHQAHRAPVGGKHLPQTLVRVDDKFYHPSYIDSHQEERSRGYSRKVALMFNICSVMRRMRGACG